jgi:hypothetical protein
MLAFKQEYKQLSAVIGLEKRFYITAFNIFIPRTGFGSNEIVKAPSIVAFW